MVGFLFLLPSRPCSRALCPSRRVSASLLCFPPHANTVPRACCRQSASHGDLHLYSHERQWEGEDEEGGGHSTACNVVICLLGHHHRATSRCWTFAGQVERTLQWTRAIVSVVHEGAETKPAYQLLPTPFMRKWLDLNARWLDQIVQQTNSSTSKTSSTTASTPVYPVRWNVEEEEEAREHLENTKWQMRCWRGGVR